jgi:hypothetical protein
VLTVLLPLSAKTLPSPLAKACKISAWQYKGNEERKDKINENGAYLKWRANGRKHGVSAGSERK